MITIQITSASKVGCVRSQNEDMILVGNHFVRNNGFDTRIDLTNNDRYIVAVADGMGGHRAGEVASNIVINHLTDTFLKNKELGNRAYFYIHLQKGFLLNSFVAIEKKKKLS